MATHMMYERMAPDDPIREPTMVSMLDAGDRVPPFSVTDSDGDLVTNETLSQGRVVLFFYPKDDTPGCTTEAKDFRDLADEFKQADTVIIGISKDPIAKHDKFKAKHDLPFTLISDADGDMCESFGVWVEKSMYGKKYMGIERATFLVAGDGTIAKIWRKVKVKGHVEEVLAAAEAL